MGVRLNLIIGFVFLVIAVIAFYIPEILHYEAQQPKEELTIAHSNSIKVSKIDFNFITKTSPQILYVDYSVMPMKNGSLAIVIPYKGEIAEMPNNWQTKKFSSGSLVLFKNFTCTSIPCVSDSEMIKFNFAEKIDSRRFPNHYVLVPFAGTPSNDEINQFINDLNSPSLQFSFGWDKVEESRLKITIDKEFDEWNTEPVSVLSSIQNQNGERNPILIWDISNESSIFAIKYSSSKDNTTLFLLQGIMGFGTGLGLGMMIDSVNANRNEKQQRKLQDFIKTQGYLQNANVEFNTKNYEDARMSYERYLEGNPNDISALNKIGRIFYKSKNYEEAFPFYQKALNIDPENKAILNNLGATLIGLKRYDEAIPLLEKAIRFDDKFEDALNNLGASLLDKKEFDESIIYFDKALTINPKDVLPLVNKAKALSGLKIYDGSLEYCNKALDIKSDDIDALLTKSTALFHLNRYNESILCCNKILQISPLNDLALFNKASSLIALGKNLVDGLPIIDPYLFNNPHDLFSEALPIIDQFLVNNPNDMYALAYKAGVLDELGKPENALIILDKVLNENPNQVESLHNKGVTLSRLKRYSEALEFFDKVLVLEPNAYDTLMSKAGILTALDKFGDAISCFDKILGLEPINIVALERKGRVLMMMNQYQRAINECIDPLLEISKNDPNFLHLKAEALRMAGKTEEAIITYERILRIDSNDTVALNDKGVCLINLQQYQEAIDQCFDETLRIDNKNIFALINKGVCMFNLEKFIESIHDCLDKVIEIDGRNSQAWYNKYWALDALGKKDEAKFCLQQSGKYKEIEDRNKT